MYIIIIIIICIYYTINGWFTYFLSGICLNPNAFQDAAQGAGASARITTWPSGWSFQQAMFDMFDYQGDINCHMINYGLW